MMPEIGMAEIDSIAAQRSGERARRVAADLEEIFSMPAGEGSPTVLGPPPTKIKGKRDGQSIVAGIGTVAAVMLVASAVGLIVTSFGMASNRQIAEKASSVVALPFRSMSGAVLAGGKTRELAAAQPGSSGASSKSALSEPPVGRQLALAVRTAGPSTPTPDYLTSKSRAGSECMTVAAAARADCLSPTISAADRRLGEAYAFAAGAGVAPPVLDRYRREWDGLRLRAKSEPYQVIDTYRIMADELRRHATAVK